MNEQTITPTTEAWESAGKDASLGVGHIWTATLCPAYRTLEGIDCTCGGAS